MANMDEGRIQFDRGEKPLLPKETNIDRIRRRAEELWDTAGRPEGKRNVFWEQAKHEILGDPSNR